MRITLIMPYYNNPAMLELHYREWAKWPEDLRNDFRFIIVDDGSKPMFAADTVERPLFLDIEIYRVLEDRPWHQHAARNLGAHVAPEGWMLLTDMDHLLEYSAAQALASSFLAPGAVYMLDRIEATTRQRTLHPKTLQPKPHPNSFVMTREMYWKIGGYDEDFCGIYGTDAFFRNRIRRQAGVETLNIPLVRYWRDVVPDASTTDLPRKEGRDPEAKNRVIARKKARGESDVIKVLQFPWERVC